MKIIYCVTHDSSYYLAKMSLEYSTASLCKDANLYECTLMSVYTCIGIIIPTEFITSLTISQDL